ncbi:MAG: hypothetical protein NTV74_04150 [Euryarchaeota archaeon]|nr:hypothetical protein [Euryarchaeota archaeon]
MKTKKNTRKIWAAVFIVALFLISSMIPVSAGLLDNRAGSIEKVKPVDSASGTAEQKPMPIFSDANGNNVLSTVTKDLNLIVMQQDQLQLQGKLYQQPSTAKKYAVIMVGRYSGPTILSYLTNITAFLENANLSYYWFLKAAGMMYNTLHDTYGYDEDNIFLLVHMLPVITYQGKTYFNTIPTTFNTSWLNYDSTYDSTKENLETVLSTFEPDGANALDDQDQLFICFIDHGGNENENYIHGIWDEFYYYEFVAPDSYENTNWFLRSEDNAYDHSHGNQGSSVTFNTDTYAVYNRPTGGKVWSDDLILKTNEIKTVKGFRINARKDAKLSQMNITFYNDNAEVKTVILDNWPDQGYKYVEFEDETIQINKVKISFYDNDTNKGFVFHPAKVYDFNLWLSGFGCGEIGQTYFGCPFITIPEYLKYLWSILWGGDGSSTEKLYDNDLRSYTSAINQNTKIIFALQPCMSGGFISELSGPNRIVCTASRGCELAEASWVEPFTWALSGTYGDPDNDGNGNDGKISIFEAYQLAAENVANQLNQHSEFPPQHPLIDDNGDYIGHHFSETNYYAPTDSTKDGYWAAQTFL